MELIDLIATEYKWPRTEILGTPIGAAFHFAMRCKRARYERLDDMRLAATFSKFDERTQSQIVGKISLMCSGPGKVVHWSDLLTDKEKKGVAESDAELERTYEALRVAGLLRTAEGGTPLSAMLKREGT